MSLDSTLGISTLSAETIIWTIVLRVGFSRRITPRIIPSLITTVLGHTTHLRIFTKVSHLTIRATTQFLTIPTVDTISTVATIFTRTRQTHFTKEAMITPRQAHTTPDRTIRMSQWTMVLSFNISTHWACRVCRLVTTQRFKGTCV